MHEPPLVPARYRAPAILAETLGALAPLVLHQTCTCPNGAWSCLPVWQLTRRYGDDRRLGEVLARLVCLRCRRRPTVTLSDSMHTAFCGGPPPGWSVVLFSPDAPHPRAAHPG